MALAQVGALGMQWHPCMAHLLHVSLQVPLEKGYSQVDWLKRSRATPQPVLRKGITMEEVRQHRTREDAWMVFRNRVSAVCCGQCLGVCYGLLVESENQAQVGVGAAAVAVQ